MPTDEVPPPPEEAKLTPPWVGDSLADKEVSLWGDEDKLKGIKTKNEARWLSVYGWIVPVMMVCFSIFYISALGVWAWHYITPWCWLTPDQLSKVQSIIFSGSVGAFVASVAQKHMIK